jgi:hypothetical protein
MSNKAEARVLVLSIALLLAGTALAVPSSAESYNNVQVFVSTTSANPYSFQFAAYNLTGSLVASYQASYPAAAFELPSGGYLFTVSATEYNSGVGYACPLEGSASQGSGVALPAVQPNKSGVTPIVLPLCYPPSSEYGYAIASVSGSQQISIQTKNITAFPTTAVTVKASYVNGTAVSDASVSASVVGQWYYWWGPNSSIVMSSQTDSNGIAHLIIPSAPSVVTAWKWVPVYLGNNESTIETNIGGQEVNVTTYWQPTYVGLSGSGLLIPPQDGLNLTLRYQQPDYWVMPAGVASKGESVSGAPGATVASQPNGTPSLASSSSGAQSSTQYYMPSQIPAIQQAVPATTGSQSGFTNTDSLVAASALFVVVALAVVVVAARRNPRRSSAPTG